MYRIVSITAVTSNALRFLLEPFIYLFLIAISPREFKVILRLLMGPMCISMALMLLNFTPKRGDYGAICT